MQFLTILLGVEINRTRLQHKTLSVFAFSGLRRSTKQKDYLLSWNPRAWALPNLAFLVKVDLSFPEIILGLLHWSIESQIHHQRHQVSLQTSFRRR